MTHRISQINELIRQEINQILLKEIEFPLNTLATIVAVETSSDLHYAKIWVSVIPAIMAQKTLNLLNRNAGHLQFLLNKKLNLKPLPRISFALDDTEEKAAGIESLLNKIKDQV